MTEAYAEAKEAGVRDDYPVGAVLVANGEIVSRGRNSTYLDSDPTAHAEINAIRSACKKLNVHKLVDFTIYTTLYPCPMCEAAIIESGISRVVFGAESFAWIREVKFAAGRVVIDGPVLEKECKSIFIAKLKEKGRTDILGYKGT